MPPETCLRLLRRRWLIISCIKRAFCQQIRAKEYSRPWNGGNNQAFIEGINQAAEGALNKNIVFAHISRGVNKKEGDKIFKYHDMKDREIDAVVINREAKTLCLIEVKSKAKVDLGWVFQNEAKHLYDNEILKNIGIDDSFFTTRVLVFRGGTGAVSHPEGTLLLVNIEDILNNYQELGGYFERLAAAASRMAKARSKTCQCVL